MTKHLPNEREGAGRTVSHAYSGLTNDGSHAPHTDCCVICGYAKAAPIHQQFPKALQQITDLHITERNDKDAPYMVQAYDTFIAGKVHIATCYSLEMAELVKASIEALQQQWNSQPEAEQPVCAECGDTIEGDPAITYNRKHFCSEDCRTDYKATGKR